MEVLSFVLALSPIAIVLIGIMLLRMPAAKVSVAALVWAMFLALTVFNITGLGIREQITVIDGSVWKGIKEGFKIVMMIFGTFTILNSLKYTGAIEDVKAAITAISGTDRRVQLIIIGCFVTAFLEGASGAGAPAALTAPFLVALGFDPITAIAVALLGDCTPVSWGAAGIATINGGDALVSAGISTTALNSAMVGHFNPLGFVIVPWIAVFMAFGFKGIRNIVHYLLFAGFSGALVMFLLSNFVGPEITSLGTGLICVLLSMVFIRLVPIRTPEEYVFKPESGTERKYSAFRAMSSYIYMIILIPLVRYGIPFLFPENGFANMCMFGYISWIDAVIILCALLGAITLKMKPGDIKTVMNQTGKTLSPVMITMGSLLCISYIMQSPSTGMMSAIVGVIVAVTGRAYPAAAVVIGAFGAFITGTGLGSNIMFAGMHIEASQILGINPIVVFAGQNAAASLGNMVCPNNVVAACATVDQTGREGEVMKLVVKGFLVILAEYMILSMIYTYILFPDFGL